MMRRRWPIWLAIALVLAVAGWFGWHAVQDRGATPADSGAEADVPASVDPAARPAGGPETVSVDTGVDASLLAGATPMAQRVAVVGLLNKRNGETRDITLKPGQATRIGDVVIRLRACERTAPWEQEQYTGAFVQLDVRGVDTKWRRAFSGWLFKERPALNVVIHPIYDVWPKSCTMSFPDSGPETVSAAAPAAPRGRTSSLPKSATPDAAPAATTEAASPAPPSAAANSTE